MKERVEEISGWKRGEGGRGESLKERVEEGRVLRRGWKREEFKERVEEREI